MASERLFYGYWPDVAGRGRTDLVVEQVSHHPPITAYHIANKAKGLALVGHSAQKTSFSGASVCPPRPFCFLLFLSLAPSSVHYGW